MKNIYIIFEIPYEGMGMAECDTENDAKEFLIGFYDQLRIKKDKRKITHIIKGIELTCDLIKENVSETTVMVTNVLFKEEEK